MVWITLWQCLCPIGMCWNIQTTSCVLRSLAIIRAQSPCQRCVRNRRLDYESLANDFPLRFVWLQPRQGGASVPSGIDSSPQQDEVDLEAERLSSMEEMLRRMKERTASLEANANAIGS